jgi:hypothetical protein
MAKKTVDPRTTALEALAQALAEPASRVLVGAGKTLGFFSGKGKETAANLCKDQGWLEPTGEFVGKGAKSKEKYRLTAAGIRAVLEQSEPLQLLRSLSGSLESQVTALRSTQEQLGQMLKSVGPLADSVAALERRLQPPNVEHLQRLMSGQTPSATAHRDPPSDGWLDRVVQLAGEQRQRDRFQPLPLPTLYQQLRQLNSNLTLGQFHDGLRKLREQQRIRLVPFTRALAQIDDPRNALFLDGEVMYYADLP